MGFLCVCFYFCFNQLFQISFLTFSIWRHYNIEKQCFVCASARLTLAFYFSGLFASLWLVVFGVGLRGVVCTSDKKALCC